MFSSESHLMLTGCLTCKTYDIATDLKRNLYLNLSRSSAWKTFIQKKKGLFQLSLKIQKRVEIEEEVEIDWFPTVFAVKAKAELTSQTVDHYFKKGPLFLFYFSDTLPCLYEATPAHPELCHSFQRLLLVQVYLLVLGNDPYLELVVFQPFTC